MRRSDPDGVLCARLIHEDCSEKRFAQLEAELETYRTRCIAAQQTIAALGDKLQGRERPQVKALREQAATLSNALLQARSNAAVAQQNSERLQDAAKRYAQREQAYGTLRDRTDKAGVFVRLLRGTAGVSLQRYILGVMLSAITNEANRLLERVHDGRYQIFRTLETTGKVHKAGLELEVLDRRSEGRRSVASLSGGEKFLVALVLSMGLSAVVQAQSGSIRLGAIFIDEGFGTLDEESMNDALHVLAAMQSAHGMVGLISHVALLRENIPTGIQVQKTRRGSSLTMTV
ncbi:MAG: SbcC/MukB-like Walker B domain-containing protein [Oscillospiraceae bacterium]|nr:SbcC/MukB-like Walker B domain-containing protein [Oscillospiraceae bacterium]